MKVVVADDDAVVIQILSMGLRKRGFEVVTALDAMQAVMATMKNAPDAVVLDLNMPGGTGVEAIRRLKNSTKTNMIPVVAITGSATPEARQSALDLGAVECIEKPVDLDALAGLLAGLTGLK
jgi:CheY-like chemotaxis protein